jgi:N6-L-threonylcarbamoyladenine synthase
MLGLGYPGGPALDRLARTGDARRQPLPRPSVGGLEYSFSGLKTALLYRLRDLGDKVTPQDRADLAAAFERSVVESLLEKLDQALNLPFAEVVVCGGVAANTLLRQRAAEVVAGRARLTMPPLNLCTDNAAMIASAGYFTSPLAGEVPGEAGRRGRPGGGFRAAEVDPSLGW